jgi:DnaJ-class molecular chaperone with C-terminal Zn finger domain
MKATLYEALGVPQLAPDEEVRAALRRLIRKYYAKTRDGQGNVEEALRFINHASRILSDPEHRQHYDQELAVTAEANTEQRISRFVSNVAATAEQEGTAAHDEDEVITAADEKLLTQPVGAPEKTLHHPGLTERVASFGRSAMGQLALCLLFGAFITGAIVFVTPADSVLVAKQVLVWLTLLLLILSLIYGIVHGLTWMRRGHVPRMPALIPQTDLAILNWRREKSVFLGTDAPQEDASWIFQLRMAELERAKSGRTSEPRPWNRLAARLFDYAIWGLVLALLLSELHNAGIVSDEVAFWLGHPLLAPMLITLSWIPVESLLIASLQQTPGKWLFGVYLQFSISNAYARRDVRAQLARAMRRSFLLVGGSRLRISAARAGPDRTGLRKTCATGRDELGFRRRLPGDAQPAGDTENGHRRRRAGGDAVAVRRCLARADDRVDRRRQADGRRVDAFGAVVAPARLPG